MRINPITKSFFHQNLKSDCENDNETLHSLVKHLDIHLEAPECVFIKQDDPSEGYADLLYFLAKGSCEVFVKDQFEGLVEETLVNKLKDGDHFGEMTMLYECNRSATVIAESYCTCAAMNRKSYM